MYMNNARIISFIHDRNKCFKNIIFQGNVKVFQLTDIIDKSE